jgi:hypothetical protein
MSNAGDMRSRMPAKRLQNEIASGCDQAQAQHVLQARVATSASGLQEAKAHAGKVSLQAEACHLPDSSYWCSRHPPGFTGTG